MSWSQDAAEAIARLFGTAAAAMRPTAAARLEDATAAGWTPQRFRAAAAEAQARLSPSELEALRLEGWDLTWTPRPLRPGVVRTGVSTRSAGKVRLIGKAGARDSVLMGVWRGLARGGLERALPDHVHGFRRGRGAQSAIRSLHAAPFPRCARLVQADVRAMFPSLDHRWLCGAIAATWGADPLIAETLRARVAGLAIRWVQAWSPCGVPTGVSISPMLSNAYFATGVDRWMSAALASGRVIAGVRYADDFALVTEDAPGVLRELEAALGRCKLGLNPEKTRVRTADDLAGEPAVVLGEPLLLVGDRLMSSKTGARPEKGRKSRRGF